MSRVYQIVLDTNVLVAAFRSQRGASNKLLSLLNDPRWQINLSTPLVLEYEEALKRPGMIEGYSDAAIDTFLAGLCAIGRHHDIFYLWRPLAHDPDDDFLLGVCRLNSLSILSGNYPLEFSVSDILVKLYENGRSRQAN